MNKIAQNSNWINSLGLGIITFFILWSIFAIIRGDIEFIFDRLFSAVLVFIWFFIAKRTRLPVAYLGFSVFTLMLHHLKLYSNVYAGIPFDRFIHTLAGISIALVIGWYLLKEQKLVPSPSIFIVFVFLAFGIASTIEIVEFVGYATLGEGEGILFYGTGDFGEWNNISWDLISNMIGAIVGTGILFFKTKDTHHIH